MSNVVGQLELQMVADLARIKQDMEAVKGIVGSGMDSVRRAASTAQAALGAIGVGLSAAAFTGWIKGAISAADEAGKLAQRMGTTVEQVAGLQLAFELGGSSSEGMGKAMTQLAKRMAEGDDALKALGIRTTDTNGKMRSSRDVLADVADRFAMAEDGARKTALAVELFGKAGAEMIPVLNAGSEGLRAMDDMARKLGLTIDGETAKQAEQFNDTMELLGKSSQGVGRMVAAELLPTLTALAGSFLNSKTEGDKLSSTAQFIANTLKVLFSVGVVGVEIFNSLGKSIGAGVGALVAFSQGNFRQALTVLQEGGGDIKAGWTSALATIEKAWSGTADAGVLGMARMTKDLPDLGNKAKAAADETIKAVQAIAKARSDARQAEEKSIDAFLLSEAQRRSAEVKAAGAAVQAAQDEYDNQGRLRSQIAEVTLQRLRDRQAAFSAGSSNYEAVQREIEAQEQLIDILRRGELRDASTAAAKAAADEWQKTADSIGQGLTDSLFRAFESGRGFADTFIASLKNLFKTTVLKIAVQPFQQATNSFLAGVFGQQQPQGAGGMLGNVQGLQSMYSAGQNVFGVFGQYGSLARSYLGLSNGGSGALNSYLTTGGAEGSIVGGGTGGGAGAVGSGATAFSTIWPLAAIAGFFKAQGDYKEGFNSSQAIKAQNSIFGGNFGQWSTEGAMANLLSSIGLNDKWASLLSGSTAVAKIIGRAAPQVEGRNIVGTVGEGGFAGTFDERVRERGGLLRSDKIYTLQSALSGQVEGAIDTMAKQLRDQAKVYAEALGLPLAAIKDYTKAINVDVTFSDAEESAKRITEAMKGYADGLFDSIGTSVQALKKAGETTQQTLERLATLQTFSRGLNDLGGVFSRIASQSVEARESLIAMLGGMDAMQAKAQSFVQNYYSREEIAGIKAREVQASLAGAGITADISTREQFRALVEAQGNTPEQLAALLNAADAFASLTDYLAETGGSLSSTAAQAPEMATLGGLFVDGSTAQVAATNAVQVAVEQVRDAVVQLTDRVTQIDGGMGAGGGRGDLYDSGPREVNPRWDDDGTGGGGG